MTISTDSISRKQAFLTYPVDSFDYNLLDNGDFQKLEKLGPHSVVRPAPQAIWPKKLGTEDWRQAEAEYRYYKGKENGGKWTNFRSLPSNGWNIRFRELTFKVNPTGFGHIGLFPEQAANWTWIEKQVQKFSGINILNIFGYTGASTLAAAEAGAYVTHVDASRPSVNWARENQKLSGLEEKPVRWIVDDVIKFLQREQRRGNRYKGLIMDPPTFGRGPKNEVWKIEKHLPELLRLCKRILDPDPAFLLMTTHSPGFSSLTLENLLLHYLIEPNAGSIESGEMSILDITSGLHLPSGFYSRWVSQV